MAANPDVSFSGRESIRGFLSRLSTIFPLLPAAASPHSYFLSGGLASSSHSHPNQNRCSNFGLFPPQASAISWFNLPPLSSGAFRTRVRLPPHKNGYNSCLVRISSPLLDLDRASPHFGHFSSPPMLPLLLMLFFGPKYFCFPVPHVYFLFSASIFWFHGMFCASNLIVHPPQRLPTMARTS